jgi:hypothetical protein
LAGTTTDEEALDETDGDEDSFRRLSRLKSRSWRVLNASADCLIELWVRVVLARLFGLLGVDWADELADVLVLFELDGDTSGWPSRLAVMTLRLVLTMGRRPSAIRLALRRSVLASMSLFVLAFLLTGDRLG